MNFKKTLLAAAAVVAMPVLAQAQNVTGPYIAAGAGVNWLQDTNLNGQVNNAAQTKLSTDFEIGFAGVLSLGWGFGNGLRAEIEGNYRINDVSNVSAGGSSVRTVANPTGTVSSYGAMANVLYDFNLGSSLGGIVPYIGGGIGYIWHDYSDVGVTQTDGNNLVYNGNSGAFGYQAIVGAAFPIESVPGLSVTAEYRFLGSTSNDINGSVNSTVNGKIQQNNLSSSVDNFNSSLLVGLRYAFNAAPVIIAQPPIPAAKTFLVFFDWSKADLTDRARQIIGEAATARGQGVTRIEVNGFTDRSGPADYNMQLSIRRANAVAAELVRRGVPRNEIVTRGFGEENNLVPTADGVREPQNRRVEIILK